MFQLPGSIPGLNCFLYLSQIKSMCYNHWFEQGLTILAFSDVVITVAIVAVITNVCSHKKIEHLIPMKAEAEVPITVLKLSPYPWLSVNSFSRTA